MAVQTDLNMDFISTHSLTRRLTTSTLLFFSSDLYFNSQPHKEADMVILLLLMVIHIFQLTASQGG